MYDTTAHRTAHPHSTHQTLLIDAHPQRGRCAWYRRHPRESARAYECEKQPPPPNFVLMEVLSPLTPKFKSANSKLIFFSRPRVPVFPVRALGLSLTVGSHMWLILYLPGVRVRGYNSGLRVRLEIDRNFFLTN